MEFEQLKSTLKGIFDEFFIDMGIDPVTGIVSGTNRRFAGYPYIGRKYATSPVKVLFIPLDTGVDECAEINTYHSFESREKLFADGELDFNPHIAGTYATALYIMKESMGWKSSWDALCAKGEKHKTAKAIREASTVLPQDLMSYIAYDNRYKFVTIGRPEGSRAGANDRVWLNLERERRILLDEIAIFDPDYIVFQGTEGIHDCGISLLENKYKVITAYHPSCWQRGADKLKYIQDTIAPQLKK